MVCLHRISSYHAQDWPVPSSVVSSGSSQSLIGCHTVCKVITSANNSLEEKGSDTAVKILPEQFLLFCCKQSMAILAAWTAMCTHISYTHKPCMQDASPCQLASHSLVCQAASIICCDVGAFDVGDGSATGCGGCNKCHHDPLHLCLCLTRVFELWRDSVSGG